MAINPQTILDKIKVEQNEIMDSAEKKIDQIILRHINESLTTSMFYASIVPENEISEEYEKMKLESYDLLLDRYRQAGWTVQVINNNKRNWDFYYQPIKDSSGQ